MTSIAELIAAGRTWSLEFFPPRDPEAEARFRASLGDFADLGPVATDEFRSQHAAPALRRHLEQVHHAFTGGDGESIAGTHHDRSG